jgi:D-beta-D-heptose 7-phosphate kinase/D-beta-D-heptose 1-phosphate adenosyltransferase
VELTEFCWSPNDGPPIELPSLAREVFDVSGAGDTVAATLSAGLAVGASVPDAVYLANVAAGIVVAKVGTAVSSPFRNPHEIENQFSNRANDKILSQAELRETTEAWLQLGLRVGLILVRLIGCLLKTWLLLKWRGRDCDRLVVAIESD